jgi:hypothetical protein
MQRIDLSVRQRGLALELAFEQEPLESGVARPHPTPLECFQVLDGLECVDRTVLRAIQANTQTGGALQELARIGLGLP